MATTPSSIPAAPAHFLRHRVAVSTMFFLNGLLVGGWAPAISVLTDKHALAESELGLMILLIGIGSLIIARRGSTSILKISAAYLPAPHTPHVFPHTLLACGDAKLYEEANRLT